MRACHGPVASHHSQFVIATSASHLSAGLRVSPPVCAVLPRLILAEPGLGQHAGRSQEWTARVVASVVEGLEFCALGTGWQLDDVWRDESSLTRLSDVNRFTGQMARKFCYGLCPVEDGNGHVTRPPREDYTFTSILPEACTVRQVMQSHLWQKKVFSRLQRPLAVPTGIRQLLTLFSHTLYEAAYTRYPETARPEPSSFLRGNPMSSSAVQQHYEGRVVTRFVAGPNTGNTYHGHTVIEMVSASCRTPRGRKTSLKRLRALCSG